MNSERFWSQVELAPNDFFISVYAVIIYTTCVFVWHDSFICNHLPQQWVLIINLLVGLRIAANSEYGGC